MIYLYNTLTRKKELFIALNDKRVGIYSCGPTVYSYQHVGNMRTFIFSDILKRVLLYNGFKVKHVINVTDVGHLTSDSDEGEDKIEIAARKEHKLAKDIADYYFSVFKEDIRKLNIIEPDFWPRATHHIKEQIELIKKLEKKGYTYKTKDGIYFDSSRFKNYGRLTRLNVKGIKAGFRVDIGEKKHVTDFALWKFSDKPGIRQQEWESPWGLGYPGWHIECSAMSMKYLGKKFDIHTGGEDHISVHHTNEIAQSEAITGKKFVNYWMHGAFLTYKGEKISKSKGGLYTISELEKMGYKAIHFRYLCLMTHYRKQLDFSLDSLNAARNAYERLLQRYYNIKIMMNNEKSNIKQERFYRDKFTKAINDDLNMPIALSVLWNVLDNKYLNHKQKLFLINEFDSVFGFGLCNLKDEKIPEEIIELIKQRDHARAKKNWEKADAIRNNIKKLGYEIEDDYGKTIVKKIIK